MARAAGARSGTRDRPAALGAAAPRTFLFYLREVFAEFLTEEHAA